MLERMLESTACRESSAHCAVLCVRGITSPVFIALVREWSAPSAMVRRGRPQGRAAESEHPASAWGARDGLSRLGLENLAPGSDPGVSAKIADLVEIGCRPVVQRHIEVVPRGVPDENWMAR